MSRQKGKRGERECAAELASLLGVTARRGVQYQGGPDSPDVVLDGVNIHVECKRTERLDLYAAITQARDECGGKVPIVWHRRNNHDSVVIIETSRLLDVCQAIMAVAVLQNAALQNATHAKVAGPSGR
jgi:Holliday junction resolvase